MREFVNHIPDEPAKEPAYTDKVSDFYDRLASTYEQNAIERGINNTLKLEVDVVASLQPGSVIEFGIGSGRFARALVGRLDPRARYVGVDTSQKMLDLAGDLSGSVELIRSDFDSYIRNTPEQFDVCVAPYTVYCHVRGERQLPLLEEIKRKCLHVFINVPTLKYEQEVWGSNDAVEFPVPGSTQKVPVFRIHIDLRSATDEVIPLDGQREMLYFKGGKS